MLRVSEVGTWGEPRPEHRFALDRAAAGCSSWSASGSRPACVLAAARADRRPPRRPRDRPAGARAATGELRWLFEYDEGIDPDDPVVEHAAEEALAAARGEVGA